MTVIDQILEGINKGRAMYGDVHGSITTVDELRGGEACELCLGDNLEYMKQLLERGYAGAFSLIYIDPPFFTRSSFNASISVKDDHGASHKVHHLAYDDKFDRSLEYYIDILTGIRRIISSWCSTSSWEKRTSSMR